MPQIHESYRLKLEITKFNTFNYRIKFNYTWIFIYRLIIKKETVLLNFINTLTKTSLE